MKRTLRTSALLIIAALAGFAVSELIWRSRAGQDAIARFRQSEVGVQAERNLRDAAQAERVRDQDTERAMKLLHDQFGDDAHFTEALQSSHLSLGELFDEVSGHLRALAWIEKQIEPQLRRDEEERRVYYRSHREQFTLPPRFRASHLFLAAPDGTPAEVVAAKWSAIQGLSIRLLAGEKLPQLAADASEDEATKFRGGDLGYFASSRMPPEFIEEIKKLRVGETSAPIRSHLGFHLVQLTDAKPPRDLGFDEAQGEIAVVLGNEKRATAVSQLKERLESSR